MKALLASLLLFPIALCAQQPADLTVTLPTGKTITFQSADQKAKYVAAQSKVKNTGRAAQEERVAKERANIERYSEIANVRRILDSASARVDLQIILFKDDGVMATVYPYVLRDRSAIHDATGQDMYWGRDHDSSGATCLVHGDFRKLGALDGSKFTAALVYAAGIEDSGISRQRALTIDPFEALKAAGIKVSSPEIVKEALSGEPLKPTS